MILRKKSKQSLLFFSILLILFLPLKAASIQCVWTGVGKIVAVGDIHGAYKNFVKILKGTELIDNDLHWIGGKTHLVQTGDIMDRGPGAKRVFDLLMRLEKEAEEMQKKYPAIEKAEIRTEKISMISEKPTLKSFVREYSFLIIPLLFILFILIIALIKLSRK